MNLAVPSNIYEMTLSGALLMLLYVLLVRVVVPLILSKMPAGAASIAVPTLPVTHSAEKVAIELSALAVEIKELVKRIDRQEESLQVRLGNAEEKAARNAEDIARLQGKLQKESG